MGMRMARPGSFFRNVLYIKYPHNRAMVNSCFETDLKAMFCHAVNQVIKRSTNFSFWFYEDREGSDSVKGASTFLITTRKFSCYFGKWCDSNLIDIMFLIS